MACVNKYEGPCYHCKLNVAKNTGYYGRIAEGKKHSTWRLLHNQCRYKLSGQTTDEDRYLYKIGVRYKRN